MLEALDKISKFNTKQSLDFPKHGVKIDISNKMVFERLAPYTQSSL